MLGVLLTEHVLPFHKVDIFCALAHWVLSLAVKFCIILAEDVCADLDFLGKCDSNFSSISVKLLTMRTGY